MEPRLKLNNKSLAVAEMGEWVSEQFVNGTSAHVGYSVP